jgi:nucleoside-diphosphate kinase
VPRTLSGVMAIEQTLILCKADAVARGLVGEIIGRFERRGYTIAGMKLLTVGRTLAERHYAEHEGKSFFRGLVEYITSAPIVALVVEGNGAVEGCRSTIGSTNPIKAAPGSIRGDYGQTIGRNLVHGSDSVESAKREIAMWFKAEELYPRSHDQERWLVSV